MSHLPGNLLVEVVYLLLGLRTMWAFRSFLNNVIHWYDLNVISFLLSPSFLFHLAHGSLLSKADSFQLLCLPLSEFPFVLSPLPYLLVTLSDLLLLHRFHLVSLQVI